MILHNQYPASSLPSTEDKSWSVKGFDGEQVYDAYVDSSSF